MGLKRRVFSKAFKEQVLLEIDGGESLTQVARERQLHPVLICKWRRQYEQYGERAFAGHGKAYSDDAQIAVLERKIGQLTMENDLLKKSWRYGAAEAGNEPTHRRRTPDCADRPTLPQSGYRSRQLLSRPSDAGTEPSRE